MPTVLANNAGNSGAEEKFIQLFCEVLDQKKVNMSICNIHLSIYTENIARLTLPSKAISDVLL